MAREGHFEKRAAVAEIDAVKFPGMAQEPNRNWKPETLEPFFPGSGTRAVGNTKSPVKVVGSPRLKSIPKGLKTASLAEIRKK